jgi:hypothetical protein
MFKATGRQVSMWEAGTWLPDSARARLSESWAEGFRQHVYPLLLEAEDQFAHLYGKTGRPNWSVARMLGCCLLQQLNDLTDQVALDALTFDLRWQHALCIESGDAYLSRRSLVEFQSRLTKHDPEMRLVRELFDRISDAALKHLKLSTTEQRIDSTLVASNIRVRGRLGLFRKTLEHFLNGLAATSPERLDLLNPALRAWFEQDEESWGRHLTKEEIQAQLARVAQWAHEVLETFAKDELVSGSERYQLLARLFSEQCELVADTGNDDDVDGAVTGRRVQVLKNFEKAGGNLRSPFDPDAGTGRKGVGYYVHVAETCRNDAPEIITDYEVVSAARADGGRATGAIERLDAAERRPEILYADGGYPTPDSLERARDAGVELYTPVNRNSMPAEKMSRQDFEFDNETGEVIRCPEGHEPTRHGVRQFMPGRFAKHAFFDGENCGNCPKVALCPARMPNNRRIGSEYIINISEGLQIRDSIFVKQTQAEWKEKYKIRSGVEATMSELKRAHGMRRLRVRTKPRVSFAVGMKVCACNVKRWLRGLATMSTELAMV